MLHITEKSLVLVGSAGQLPVPLDDPILPKLAMLYEGECEGSGPLAAAAKFGYSKQRYFQLRQALQQGGTQALQNQKRGPKTHYRRTDQVIQQVVRHRFLDPDATCAVIGQKLRQTGQAISTRSVERVVAQFGLQKKLHVFRPGPRPAAIQTQRTKLRQKLQPADPESLQRGVRQLLADKISGTLVGLWLLIPEHLRLGTWDLLRGWTGQPADTATPRLALQLVHEAALCLTGVRQGRTLGQIGFELANGLPFIASDPAIHQLLDAHTVEQAQELQVALGLIRRARGHFAGRLLAIDPHRLQSYSQRRMRLHPLAAKEDRPGKCAQTFFALDPDTHQPVCVLTGCSARTVSQVTPDLLSLAERILRPSPQPGQKILVLADSEHFTLELLDQFHQHKAFDLLVPMPNQPYFQKQFAALPQTAFTPQWAGLALAQQPWPRPGQTPPLYQLIQRTGEHPAQYQYKGFACTAPLDGRQGLITDFPKRWHVEEFFHDHQELGWRIASTHNLNVRYGRMTLALLAQASLHQLRQRLGEPFVHWQASHLAKSLLAGLDGDIRVHADTIVVTFYNAPRAKELRPHYENLPARLEAEGIKPNIPWLYDFKLDFRFK